MPDLRRAFFKRLGLIPAADLDLTRIRAALDAVARDHYAIGFDDAAQSSAMTLRDLGELDAMEVPRALCHHTPFEGERRASDAQLRDLGLHLEDLGVPMTRRRDRYRFGAMEWDELPAVENPRPSTDYDRISRSFYDAYAGNRRPGVRII